MVRLSDIGLRVMLFGPGRVFVSPVLIIKRFKVRCHADTMHNIAQLVLLRLLFFILRVKSTSLGPFLNFISALRALFRSRRSQFLLRSHYREAELESSLFCDTRPTFLRTFSLIFLEDVVSLSQFNLSSKLSYLSSRMNYTICLM